MRLSRKLLILLMYAAAPQVASKSNLTICI